TLDGMYLGLGVEKVLDHLHGGVNRHGHPAPASDPNGSHPQAPMSSLSNCMASRSSRSRYSRSDSAWPFLGPERWRRMAKSPSKSRPSSSSSSHHRYRSRFQNSSRRH